MLRIQDNHMARQVQRHLSTSQSQTAQATQRLGSGYRINTAGDDAAGLHIAEGLQARKRGIIKSIQNVQDGLNVLALADGYYQTVKELEHRARELLVQAGNDTLGTEQRDAIEAELDQIAAEVDRIGQVENPFTGGNLFNGSATLYIQVNNDHQINLNVSVTGPPGRSFGAFTSSTFGLSDSNMDVSTSDNARTSLGLLDNGGTSGSLSSRRVLIGGLQSALNSEFANLQVELENVSQAQSRIKDADTAEESINLVQGQIKQNSSVAMLTQANAQNAQIALGLIGA